MARLSAHIPTLLAWAAPLGAVAAAILSFWTGGVHPLALACTAVLFALAARGVAVDRGALGFLGPALLVGLATTSGLGALEGLLWGGFVRVFLLLHILGPGPVWSPTAARGRASVPRCSPATRA
jgi:hypothetical protein